MNLLAEGDFEIPGEALSVILLLLISFFSWLKNRFGAKQQEPEESEEDARLRELVWRRQMGEAVEQRDFYDEIPVHQQQAAIRFDQPKQVVVSPPPMAPPPPPPLPPPAVVHALSRRERELASAFEGAMPGRQRQKTDHRKEVDQLLRSPSAAKNAILLMEILGPPVALKTAGEDHI